MMTVDSSANVSRCSAKTPFEFGIRGLQLRNVAGANRQFAETFRPEIVRNGNADFCFDDRPDGNLNVSLGHVLMDAVIRKASEAFVLLEAKNFGFVRGRSTHYHVGDLPEVHRNTPTFTLRKRAGEAPCPVPMVCIGSPLPQLGVPQSL